MQQAVAGGPGEVHHDVRLRAAPGRRPPARHARPWKLAAAPGGQRPPRAPRPAAPQIVIAGAHGGAGASTLAALLRLHLAAPGGHGPRVGEMPPAPDADPARIAAAGWLPVPPPGTRVIIAARGTAEGARRAVIAVTALERHGIYPVAVAVVADGAGPEPRQAPGGKHDHPEQPRPGPRCRDGRQAAPSPGPRAGPGAGPAGPAEHHRGLGQVAGVLARDPRPLDLRRADGDRQKEPA